MYQWPNQTRPIQQHGGKLSLELREISARKNRNFSKTNAKFDFLKVLNPRKPVEKIPSFEFPRCEKLLIFFDLVT